jgi:hypothetical protein
MPRRGGSEDGARRPGQAAGRPGGGRRARAHSPRAQRTAHDLAAAALGDVPGDGAQAALRRRAVAEGVDVRVWPHAALVAVGPEGTVDAARADYPLPAVLLLPRVRHRVSPVGCAAPARRGHPPVRHSGAIGPAGRGDPVWPQRRAVPAAHGRPRVRALHPRHTQRGRRRRPAGARCATGRRDPPSHRGGPCRITPPSGVGGRV